ncbi:GNAT family N-acetyltransferase [Afifella pfennigii]|uniref:GNAT family N-acetyltransferase n=1 Tax=Afifella pfennigii TaxID=209897 RepID=UPI0004795F5B|nr:GNAT family N-acetyltransferase [Afifella pfennigii]
MGIEFLPRAQIPAQDWDALVNASPDGWVFALSGWQDLILAVEPWGLEDLSFATLENGRLVAVMPLQIQRASGRAGSSGWGWAGPIIAVSVEASHRKRLWSRALRHAEKVGADAGANVLEVGLSPLTETSQDVPWQVNPFIEAGFEDLSTVTRMIDLSVGQEALWSGLSANARQMVRKAETAGYTVERCDWGAYADRYFEAHRETYHRTGVSPHPKAYFDGIANHIAPEGYAVLLVGFSPSGEPIAFHNDATIANGRLYHTGCSFNGHLDSGINYLLMWRAITGALESGCRWYEVGDVFPWVQDGKQRGLTVFKSKFGGELHRSFKARKALRSAAAKTDLNGALPITASNQGGANQGGGMPSRAAYAAGSLYATEKICRAFDAAASEYVDRLLHDRFSLVARNYRGGALVDLCCAAGAHLVDLSTSVDQAIGLDFSERYLQAGRALAEERGRGNVAFAGADARALPLGDASVDCLYCFSSLYAIPQAETVVAEVGRVLKPGGRAILDFGNRRSLNAYCLQFYTDWPETYPLSLKEIGAAIGDAGLAVKEHRCFQLLPLWAGRPNWLRPLLHPVWREILKRRVFGRMLDERISSLPLLRRFAFRHLIVVERRS